jgi:hypothetical protein
MKLNKFTVIIFPLMLAACSSGDVKDTLGLRKSAPDEFNVISNPPLYIPPEFNLVSPEVVSEALGSNTVSSSAQVDSSDKSFLNSLGDNQIAGGGIKKKIDDEYVSKQQEEKRKGAIRKAVSKLSGPEDEKYVDPVLEKERIRQNLEKSKPINEGEVPIKKSSTIDRLFD